MIGQDNKIFLKFGAIDEMAVVYLDGKFVGKHDEGWNKFFQFEIAELINDFEKPHSLAVQVHDSLMAGGIWKKVWLEGID